MRVKELAEEFASLWQDLRDTEINEVLIKNVPMDFLDFAMESAHTFVGGHEELPENVRLQLANPMLAGYIIRLLEERVK